MLMSAVLRYKKEHKKINKSQFVKLQISKDHKLLEPTQ